MYVQGPMCELDPLGQPVRADGDPLPANISAALRRAVSGNKKFIIRLDAAQREAVERVLRSKTCSRRDHVRAQAILLADDSQLNGARTDQEIAKLTNLSVRTIETLRRRFVEDGLSSAVSYRTKPAPDKS